MFQVRDSRHPFGRTLKREHGFTLIEIMVVVIVLGILAVSIIPQFKGLTNDAKVAKATSTIGDLENALERFYYHMDRYPTTQEGLKALVEQPQDGEGKWRGYINKLIDDPWGQPYQYRSPGLHGNKSYDLWSRGADGEDGGEGPNKDITNWTTE